MKDLIEKLEKASGPLYSLDCAIAETMLPAEWFGSKVESWFGFGNGVYGCNTADGKRHLECLRAAPYTSSIDAALTLVPEGCYADMTERCAKSSPMRSFGAPGRFRAVVNTWGDERHIGDTHDVRAIALCIAALRARSDGGEG